MADNTDVAQLPSDGVNKPTSGTYGTGAELSRLKSALPRNPPSAGGPPPSPGPAGGGAPTPAPPRPRQTGAPGIPEGVPSAIAAPTTRPNTPVGTPLGGGDIGPQGATQKRLATLHQLANGAGVSPETREWAKMVLNLVSS